jgi:hypothetical protein
VEALGFAGIDRESQREEEERIGREWEGGTGSYPLEELRRRRASWRQIVQRGELPPSCSSVQRKTMTKGRWAGRGEGKSWAENGPSKEGAPFFQKLFLFSVFPKSFAVLQKDFADSKLFTKT